LCGDSRNSDRLTCIRWNFCTFDNTCTFKIHDVDPRSHTVIKTGNVQYSVLRPQCRTSSVCAACAISDLMSEVEDGWDTATWQHVSHELLQATPALETHELLQRTPVPDQCRGLERRCCFQRHRRSRFF
jgi:hypothetical protein